MSLLRSTRPDAPHLDLIRPLAALPGGSFEVTGTRLAGGVEAAQLPRAYFGGTEAAVELLRPTRMQVRVPDGAITGDLLVRSGDTESNVVHASVAVPIADDLHMISNPAVDADENVFAMISGPRGTRVPVSIVIA